MEFETRRLIMQGPFISVFLAFYNYFLISYLFDLFYPLSFSLKVTIVSIIFIFQLVSLFVELNHSNIITRFLMEISEIWKWASLMYLFDLIIIYTLNSFITLPNYLVYGLILLVPLIGIYAYYNAHHLTVKEYNLNTGNIKDDVAIIQMSDLHIGSIRGKNSLKKVASTINEIYEDNLKKGIKNNIVIISGDLADGTCPISKDSFKPLLNSKVPLIFTPGNHDFYQGIENIFNACRETDIKILNDDVLTLNEWGVNIIGLTFSFSPENMSESFNTDFIKEDYFNILNFHVPLNWEYFSSIGVDLQLSGHTHGGQFYPVTWILNRVMFRHNRGLFSRKVNNKSSYLYVNDGTGTMGPPLRWGTKAEIAVFHLKH